VPVPSRTRSAPVGSAASAEERVERWHQAVRRGSHSAVQNCLRDGWAPVNATDSAGYTALMRSCVSGRLLALLLDTECDVNATAAADRSTALLIASRHRSARIVDHLLQKGARMTRDRTGATVLHKAAANSDPSVLRLLLQAGAEPYLRDSDGRCALTTALLSGNQEAALVMLEERSRCLHGRRALQAAQAAGRAAPGRRPARSGLGAGGVASSAALTRAADSASDTDALTSAIAGLDVGLVRSEGLDGVVPSLADLPDDALDLIVQAALATCDSQTSTSTPSVSLPSEGAGGSRAPGHGAPAAVPSDTQGLLPGHPALLHTPSAAASSAADPIAAGYASAALRPAATPGAGAASHAPTPAAMLRVLCATSPRLRSACQRHELSRWTSTQSLNAPVARLHPRWQQTTLLHLAAGQGMEEVAAKLVTRGAKLDARDSCGLTALDEARAKNRPIMAALLLSWAQRERERLHALPARGEESC